MDDTIVRCKQSTLVDIFFIVSTGCTRRTLQFIYLSRHSTHGFDSYCKD